MRARPVPMGGNNLGFDMFDQSDRVIRNLVLLLLLGILRLRLLVIGAVPTLIYSLTVRKPEMFQVFARDVHSLWHQTVLASLHFFFSVTFVHHHHVAFQGLTV